MLSSSDLPHSLDGESKYTSLLIPSSLPLGDYAETRHGETRSDDVSINETSPHHDYRVESLHEPTSPGEIFPFVIHRLAPLPDGIYWELLPHVFSGSSLNHAFVVLKMRISSSLSAANSVSPFLLAPLNALFLSLDFRCFLRTSIDSAICFKNFVNPGSLDPQGMLRLHWVVQRM